MLLLTISSSIDALSLTGWVLRDVQSCQLLFQKGTAQALKDVFWNRNKKHEGSHQVESIYSNSVGRILLRRQLQQSTYGVSCRSLRGLPSALVYIHLIQQNSNRYEKLNR